MTSYQIALAPHRRAAARFIAKVRRKLLQALAEEEKSQGLKQVDIARLLGVHRSVINKELRGEANISVGRIAELAYALGRRPEFSLLEIGQQAGSNVAAFKPIVREISDTSSSASLSMGNRTLTVRDAQ